MKRLRCFAMIISLTCTLVLTSCDAAKQILPEKTSALEISESFLDIDEESREFTSAIICRNNGNQTHLVNFFGKGLDENGNEIEPAKIDGYEQFFCITIGPVEPGDTKLGMIEGNDILSFFEEVPDSIVWEATPIRDGTKPDGLSVEEVTYEGEEDGGDVYTVRIRNSSESDYRYAPDQKYGDFDTDQGPADIELFAVFRDDEGKIESVSHGEIFLEGQDLPKGETAEFRCFLMPGEVPEGKEPEFHVSYNLFGENHMD